jgi:hypothetical protein
MVDVNEFLPDLGRDLPVEAGPQQVGPPQPRQRRQVRFADEHDDQRLPEQGEVGRNHRRRHNQRADAQPRDRQRHAEDGHRAGNDEPRRARRAPGNAQARRGGRRPRNNGNERNREVANALNDALIQVQGERDAIHELARQAEPEAEPQVVFAIDAPPRRNLTKTIQWSGIYDGVKWHHMDTLKQRKHVRDQASSIIRWVAGFLVTVLAYKPLEYITEPGGSSLLQNDFLLQTLAQPVYLLTKFLQIGVSLSIKVAFSYSAYSLYFSYFQMFTPESILYTHTHTIVDEERMVTLHDPTAHPDTRAISNRQMRPLYEQNVATVNYTIGPSPLYQNVPFEFPMVCTIAAPILIPNRMASLNRVYHICLETLSHILNNRTAHPSLSADPALLADKMERAASSLNQVNYSRDDSIDDVVLSATTTLYATSKILHDFESTGPYLGFQLAGNL